MSKVINAEVTNYDNIKFKSKLEARAYKLLIESGLNPQYEGNKVILLDGFYPSVKFYKGKTLSLSTKKVLGITYSPDFIVHNRVNHYIETKGFKTDSYNIKVKLFRRWLELNDSTAVFYEVNSISELKQAIQLIKDYGN